MDTKAITRKRILILPAAIVLVVFGVFAAFKIKEARDVAFGTSCVHNMKLISLPLIMSNNSGYWTGFQVQNVGTAATNITINYGANIAGTFAPTSETATLQPNESKTFLQNTGQWATPKYVGSATITTTGQPVVAIVNQVNTVGTALGTAYDGFDPAGATDKVSAPLIMANNSGYYTGVQVMNVGSSSTNVTVTYGPNLAGTYAPPPETATLGPGDSYNSIQNGGAWGSNKYVGSLTVQASSL